MKKHAIVIDSCAISLLIDQSLDIGKVLPVTEFKIFAPHFVFAEIDAIQDLDKRKKHSEFMRKANIETTGTFGFSVNEGEGNQPSLGFDEGVFAGEEEIEWRSKNAINFGSMKKNGWYGNETDFELAFAAEHSIVITAENKGTKGPLKQKARQDRIVRISIHERYTEEAINKMIKEAIKISGLEAVDFHN